MADAGQAVVTAEGAGVAVAVDVQQLGDAVEVGDQPAARRAAVQALAEAIERGGQVTYADAVGQRLRHAAVADVAVLLRAHAVVLVGQAAAQGEGGRHVEGQVDLGGVEAVVHVLRVQAHFADVAATRGAVGIHRRGAVAQPLPRGRIAQREGEGHRWHAGAVAHVQHEAIQVAVVEADHGEHRPLEAGRGMTNQRIQAQRIVEAVLEVQAGLLELGALLDGGRFGAEVDVVEHAVDQPVLRIHLRLAHHDLGLAAVLRGAVQVGADRILALVLVQLGVHQVEVEQAVRAEAELQRAGDTEPLDLVFGADVAWVTRNPRIGGRLVGGDVLGGRRRAVDAGAAVGGIDAVAAPAIAARLVGGTADALRGFIRGRVARRLRVVAGRAAEAVGAVVGGGGLVGVAVVAVLPAHWVVAFLEDRALAPRHRHQRTEAAIGPGVAQQRRHARVFRARQFVVAVLAVERGLEAFEIERPRCAQVDGGAQRAFIHLRRLGLVDLDPAEQLGGEGVEVEAAAAVDAGGAAACGGQRFQAVDAYAGEIRTQAAYGNLLAFAAFAVDGDTGDALHRFGQVQIGKLADVLGVDRIDLLDAVALFVQRLLQAFTVGGLDLHLVQVDRIGGGRSRFRGLLCMRGVAQHQSDRQGKHGERRAAAVKRERRIHLKSPPRVSSSVAKAF